MHKSSERPLSPFMLGKDYKLQLHSLMSFLHRLSGIALIVVLLAIGCWLGGLASGETAFNRVNTVLTHWLFFPFLLLGTCAACYHFCNGLRHLMWDAGQGLEKAEIAKSGRLVQISTVMLVILLLIVGFVS